MTGRPKTRHLNSFPDSSTDFRKSHITSPMPNIWETYSCLHMKETKLEAVKGMLLWITTGFSGGKNDREALLRSVSSSKIRKGKTARMALRRSSKKNKNNRTRKTGEEINRSSS